MTSRGIPHAGGRGIGSDRSAGDDGSADPALIAAIDVAGRDPARMPVLVAALHDTRVLAPVVAGARETERTADGLLREKTADIAVPLLLDGSDRALPVFTDLAAMARWNPDARPVPVTGSVAAQVAVAEGALAIVIDIAGPTALVLPGPEVRALADGRGRRPAWDDPALANAVAQVLERTASARSARLEPCAGKDARLTVTISAEADHAQVARLLADAVAALPEVRSGVRGLELTVVSEKDGATPSHQSA